MNFLKKKRLVKLISASAMIAAGFVSFILVARAQMPQVPNMPTMPSMPTAPTPIDLQSKFAEIFSHIKLQPHMAVCGTAAAGDARCNAQVVVDDQGNPQVSRNVVLGSFGPTQFLGAYGLTGTAIGSPILAVVDAYDDPYIASDLTTYSKAFPGLSVLPACSTKMTIASSAVPCFQKVSQTGSTTRYPMSNSGWGLEISLDVEIAHAVCQNCKILLVEANSASYNDLMSAVDRARLTGAKYISNSYGSSEFSGETAYDSHFNYPGIAFTFSAGDSGYGVSYPAASQYVTAVGGTTLVVTSTVPNKYTYVAEQAWSGTGSGCSKYEAKPSWQTGVTDSLCPANRMVNDVSADADPNTGAAVYDSFSYYGMRGWFQVGGTSLSSPIVAATYAWREMFRQARAHLCRMEIRRRFMMS